MLVGGVLIVGLPSENWEEISDPIDWYEPDLAGDLIWGCGKAPGGAGSGLEEAHRAGISTLLPISES